MQEKKETGAGTRTESKVMVANANEQCRASGDEALVSGRKPRGTAQDPTRSSVSTDPGKAQAE